MRRPTRGALAGMSRGELEVLTLMAAGQTNRSIASTLYLSPKTVESRIGSIFRRLGLVDDGDENRRVMAVLFYSRAVMQAQQPS